MRPIIILTRWQGKKTCEQQLICDFLRTIGIFQGSLRGTKLKM